MSRKKHNKDKKLHNSEEKLHNSHTTGDDEPNLTLQETIDLLPDDEVEEGSEIYYFTDEQGNVHSREFLTQELITLEDIKPRIGEITGNVQEGLDKRAQDGLTTLLRFFNDEHYRAELERLHRQGY